MRIDRQTLLRGLAKFVAVVVAAGLVGAGLGIALAKLSGNEGGETAQSAPATSTAPPASTTPAAVAPDAPAAVAPRIEVLSALLGRTSQSTGRALVAARVRITNRTDSRISLDDPALLAGQDEFPPNESAASNSVLRPLAPAASATGTVRFVLPPIVTRRLTANPTAQSADRQPDRRAEPHEGVAIALTRTPTSVT